MAQQAGDVLDLVAMTQKDLGKGKFTMAATDYQEFIGFRELLRSKRVSMQSGTGIQWNVMTKHAGAAHVTGLFAVEPVNYASVMQTASVDWRHISTNYPIDERMIAMNRTPARIVNLVTTGRTQANVGLAELVEGFLWEDTPAANTNDPFGVPYYLVNNATAGFTGGNPTYDSTGGAGGLDSVTHERWRNWSDNYVNISKADLIRRMRKAATKTKFVNPVAVPEYGGAISRGIYTNYDVIAGCEEALEDQNDNLGNDLASKDGRTMFRGTPLTWVPYLDSAVSYAANDTVLGIDWSQMELAFLAGEFMKEVGPTRIDLQPRTIVTFIFCTYNLVCRKRQSQFRIQKA